ncbi:hypothetical protein [Mesorhizobium sp. B3-1-7]|uniref:hypothetical protein n=1 Tax=unclassified Mesorhizobium TaxID=325217 RepID=UPI0032B2D36A
MERRRDILQALIPAGNRIQFSEAMAGLATQCSTWSTWPASKAWFRSGRGAATAAARPLTGTR